MISQINRALLAEGCFGAFLMFATFSLTNACRKRPLTMPYRSLTTA